MTTPRDDAGGSWTPTGVVCAVLAVLMLPAVGCLAAVYVHSEDLHSRHSGNREVVSERPAMQDLAWSSDGDIYFMSTPHYESPSRLWRQRRGGELEYVGDLTGEMCGGLPLLRDIDVLLERRLGVVLECQYGNWSFVAPAGPDGYSETLLTSPVPFTEATWDPRTRQGFVASNRNGCSGFARFRGVGDEPVPPPPDQAGAVERFSRSPVLGGRTWPLDGPLFGARTDNCPELGVAGWPRVRPGRHGVVFLAAPDAPPLGTKPSRWDLATTAVYAWDLASAAAREVAGGFSSPDGLEMSPDGRSVALVANRAGKPGVWLVDLDTGTVTSVASGEFYGLTYSPKGDQLATLSAGEIRILDLP